MRILHISKYYYPYVGGVENVCKYIVDNSAGHEVAVICFNEGHLNSVGEVDGIKVYRVGALVTIARQAISLSYFTVLRKVIKRFKPDIIHFHWANPYPAAILLMVIPKSVKLIIHWHMDIIKQRKIYRFVKPIETRLLKRADLVVVTSPQYRDESAPLQPFKDKVRVVPNGIDESSFKSPSGKKIDAIKKKNNGKKIVSYSFFNFSPSHFLTFSSLISHLQRSAPFGATPLTYSPSSGLVVSGPLVPPPCAGLLASAAARGIIGALEPFSSL